MDYNKFKKTIFKCFADSLNFELSDIDIEKFYEYMNLLIETNKVMNLTAIVEPIEIIKRHFLDSSYFVKFYSSDLNGKQIIDVGTGAGFPGIPLSIILKDVNFVLTDTLGKRINFLNEVINKLELKNVKLIKSRAEDLARDKNYREMYDFCLSRGVSRLSILSEYSLPFVKVGGKMVAYKMNDCDREINDGINAIKTLGGMFHVKHQYKLIDDEPDRCLVEINKLSTTNSKYPRKAGIPSKEPL